MEKYKGQIAPPSFFGSAPERAVNLCGMMCCHDAEASPVFGLVYLFIHSVTYVTLDMSITDYNSCNIQTSTQYNTVNNNTKFKYLLEVKFATTSRFMCIDINIPKSSKFKLKVI